MVLRHNGAKKHPEQRASERNRKDHRTDCDGTQGNSMPNIISEGVITKKLPRWSRRILESPQFRDGRRESATH